MRAVLLHYHRITTNSGGSRDKGTAASLKLAKDWKKKTKLHRRSICTTKQNKWMIKEKKKKIRSDRVGLADCHGVVTTEDGTVVQKMKK